MKIAVYAICKNEEKFVDRWVKSMSEADEIYVLDTGSTDNTVKKLIENNVIVKVKKYKNWRFDKARNDSLKMVHKDVDICVCTDLDEIFKKGWRKKLENSWNKNTNRLRYIYNWSLDENNNPKVSFYNEKIHDRNNYKWIHPVHEILEFNGLNENIITTDEIIINHFPDSSKSRSSYLPLLELSVKENPNNDRNMHYLGREYMYYRKWNEAIDTLIKHLNLPNAVWKDERSASMRFISRCYINLNRINEAKMWLNMAMKETPYLRDPLVEKALLAYKEADYKNVYNYSLKASKIKTHEKTYINEVFSWDHTIYDLLSLSSYYYKNDLKESLKWIKKALILSPNDERLQNNKNIFEKEIKNLENF